MQRSADAGDDLGEATQRFVGPPPRKVSKRILRSGHPHPLRAQPELLNSSSAGSLEEWLGRRSASTDDQR
jgi:hypothetical protein